MRRVVLVLLLACLAPTSAETQTSLATFCEHPPATGHRNCLLTAQALASTQPAVGILAAGGAPITAGPGGAGFRLGILPRVTAGLRWNVVPVRLPDIINGATPDDSTGPTIDGYIPALNGEVAVALSDGFVAGPGIAGIGALSLIGTFSYLPLSLFGSEPFDDSSHGFGLGARLQLLNESFTVPGVSFSVVRRSMDEVHIGDVCRGIGLTATSSETTGEPVIRDCPIENAMHAGEAAFDLTDWSTRLVVGKHLRGLGVGGGIGHHWYSSEAKFAARIQPGEYLESPAVDLSTNRWSAFGNVSYTLLVGTIGVEAGWQQGGSRIAAFDEARSAFSAGKGNWFGQISGRIAL